MAETPPNPERVEFLVCPARNKIDCLEKFGPIAAAMAAAHAEMLRRAIQERDRANPLLAKEALRDARANLEAQMQLAQIELFIHNLPDA